MYYHFKSCTIYLWGDILLKVTNKLIKFFENEQSQWGTRTAIHNLLWLLASEQLKDIGVKTLTTKYFKVSRKSVSATR